MKLRYSLPPFAAALLVLFVFNAVEEPKRIERIREQVRRVICIRNLEQLEGAREQVFLERRLKYGPAKAEEILKPVSFRELLFATI